jgi:protein TonB
MRSTNENSFTLPAWGVSLALHGAAVWLALVFTAQVKPVLQEEIFKWDVAFVGTAKTESAAEATPEPSQVPAEKIVPRPVGDPPVVARRPVVPPPDAVMHRIAPQQTAQMVHPEVEPPKPVEPREEPPPVQKMDTPTPVTKPIQEKPVEPVEQQIAEPPKMPAEPMTAKEPEPQQPAEQMIAQRQPVTSPPSETRETLPAEASAKPSAPPVVESSSPVGPSPAVLSPPTSAPSEAAVQTAKAAPGPETKPDHRWLAESLWRRVAELKRYPSSARLNGQEGKVVLKAVIRSDGHLIEVTVQKSSGHQILDAAAIEAVKLACPLHMKHAITKPEIVVSLPIVYSLAN